MTNLLMFLLLTNLTNEIIEHLIDHWIRVMVVISIVCTVSIFVLFSVPEYYKSESTFFYNSSNVYTSTGFNNSAISLNDVTQLTKSRALAKSFLAFTSPANTSLYYFDTEKELAIKSAVFLQNISVGKNRKDDIFTIALIDYTAVNAQKLLSGYIEFLEHYITSTRLRAESQATQHISTQHNLRTHTQNYFNVLEEIEYNLLRIQVQRDAILVIGMSPTKPLRRFKPQRFKSLLLIMFVSSFIYLLVFVRRPLKSAV